MISITILITRDGYVFEINYPINFNPFFQLHSNVIAMSNSIFMQVGP